MQDYVFSKIKQHFTQNALADVRSEVRKELVKLNGLIASGNEIAVAVGSRGIDHLSVVVQEVASYIKEKGAHPFIVPAMGSHGGATAEGQAKILAGYGITEAAIGAPVRATMDVVEQSRGVGPNPIFMDKLAHESDGVVLINRIKPHTDYHGTYESGLVKMAVIGLGKEKMARAIHQYGVFGLMKLIPPSAKEIFSTGKILGGVALVENAYDQTMIVRALATEDILAQEPALLEQARANMPFLPIDDIDVLIIDHMGKDISGVGIDPNIIGRMRIRGQEEPEVPNIKAIVVTDLTHSSHGNATGMGLADVITKRLYDKIDFDITYKNIVTSGFFERGKLPLVAKNDREAFAFALRSCGNLQPLSEKVIRIKNTLQLSEMYISPAVMETLKDDQNIEPVRTNVPLFINGPDLADL